MASKPRVLMVEDQRDIADLYQLKLELDGFFVAVAQDGAAGLKLARSLRPDLILLDVHVPALDGLQLLAALREEQGPDSPPVVICSEDDSPQLVREARRLGAAAYLVKSHLLPSALSQTVSEVLADRGGASRQAQGRRGARQVS